MSKSVVYVQLKTAIINGEVNMRSGTFKAMLVTKDYQPDRKAHKFRSDITHELPALGGYERGGKPLKRVRVEETADGAGWFADAVSFSDVPAGVAAVVIYHARFLGQYGNQDELVAFLEVPAEQRKKAKEGGDIFIEWSDSGILTLE